MTNLQSKRFWMVWTPSGTGPTKCHDTHESAHGEAERLAKQHPERVFFVLVAEKGVRCQPQPVDSWGLY